MSSAADQAADQTVPLAGVTVDLVVLTIRDDELVVLCVRRGIEPYAGRFALPGGFVRPDETLVTAAARELVDETGLVVASDPGGAPASAPAGAPEGVHLEQLATYGDPGRDPRLRVVSIAYLALAPSLPAPRAGSDAADVSWLPVAGLLTGLAGGRDELAFDHGQILADGVERARAKLEYSPLATAFCPPVFTVGQLRRVYEIVWGTRIDPRNFHRKVTGTPGFLVPAGGSTAGERGRPARLYRKGDAELLHPALLRGSSGAYNAG
ncbi:MAG TPA: NUDIX domain-containing protein [Streptosporangiaceae bacterium]|nr:NUDIX domain-containing protein [Streptosporangiaceae bacterium]